MRSMRHEFNPFTQDMVVPVRDRQVRLSVLEGDQPILLNPMTGETRSTHISTYRRVDGEQFIKLFSANIALTFNLSPPGIKAFNVLIWAMQSQARGKDMICLDSLTRGYFLKAHHDSGSSIKLSPATFARGLADLVDAQIIARTLRQGVYWINPNFVFNGDRVAFTTILERNRENPSQEAL